MAKFAKVFDIEDKQLLVRTRQNDDGYPELACTTEIDGIGMTTSISFEPKNDDQKALDEAWGYTDKHLNSFSQQNAEAMRQTMISEWKNLRGERG